MPGKQIVATLQALECEQRDVEQQVHNLRQQLGEAENHLAKLNAATGALKMLIDLEHVESAAGHRYAGDHELQVVAPEPEPEAPVDATPERLKKYLPVGGQRLRSKLMVFDLLQKIGHPVNKDQLRREFFDYFHRDDLERHWVRPENALNTAIDRAREDGLILQVEDPHGGPPLYTPHFRDTATGLPAFYAEEDDQ